MRPDQSISELDELEELDEVLELLLVDEAVEVAEERRDAVLLTDDMVSPGTGRPPERPARD